MGSAGIETLRREFGREVRRQALQRARYRCQECGFSENLELHHIGHRADCSLFNCAVLCADCHHDVHAEQRQQTR